MQSIGVFHTKGGVGKSAVTVFLADFLSSLHERRVLVVDLDPQGSSARALIPEDRLKDAFEQGRSLSKVLTATSRGKLTRKAVENAMIRREPTSKPRRGSVPLAEIAVLATEPRGYRTLTDQPFEHGLQEDPYGACAPRDTCRDSAAVFQRLRDSASPRRSEGNRLAV